MDEVAVVVGEPRPANKPRLVGTHRAGCHRGRAKRNGRRNNKNDFAHERSSLDDAVTCKMMQLTAAKLSRKAQLYWPEPLMLRDCAVTIDPDQSCRGDHPDWVFEAKFDGFRAAATVVCSRKATPPR
jgi:ATP-dependent DNA ligase